jgi:hypothetical protein
VLRNSEGLMNGEIRTGMRLDSGALLEAFEARVAKLERAIEEKVRDCTFYALGRFNGAVDLFDDRAEQAEIERLERLSRYLLRRWARECPPCEVAPKWEAA